MQILILSTKIMTDKNLYLPDLDTMEFAIIQYKQHF